jgi:hypothetical protein
MYGDASAEGRKGMPRFVQKECARGSQKWLQRAVNRQPGLLDGPILVKLPDARNITWRSPLADDQYAEYRDAEFLEKIGAGQLTAKLAKFWPSHSPQWDGLAISDAGDILLVEAKAHVEELCGPTMQAASASRARIDGALRDAARFMRAEPCAPWSSVFYQLANRLAYLHFLRKHRLKAWLVLANFVGDEDVRGPSSAAQWEAAYRVVWHVLGVPRQHKLSRYVIEIYPHVDGFQDNPSG